MMIFLVVLFFIFPLVSFAQGNIIVAPTIIEEKAEARDILELSIKLKNLKSHKIDLYPIINDISIEEGEQEFLDPSLMDKSASLAYWTKISRGVIELFPGEEKEIPFEIHVNLNAQPGKYYARILFSQGANRIEAEAQKILLNQAQVMVNLEVEEHIIEKAQTRQFRTAKEIFFSSPVKFFLEIENIGNQDIKLTGDINIYNRKGQEAASININQLQADILSNSSRMLEFDWFFQKNFGRYKAVLTAEYGEKAKRDLQDTIYFWILPWSMLIFFSGSVIFFFILFLFILKKSKKIV